MAKVLIVDDEEGYRFYPSVALEKAGHKVRSAGDGPEAIEIGNLFVPDVLIADWRLPQDYSGPQVAEAIRNVNPNLQTIVITGYSADEIKSEAHNPIFKILEKPFGIEDLIEAVSQAAQSSQTKT